jgi:hypothetical protein
MNSAPFAAVTVELKARSSQGWQKPGWELAEQPPSKRGRCSACPYHKLAAN